MPVCVFAFDLLYADGEALVHLPLRARRERLAAALPNLTAGVVELANARELPLPATLGAPPEDPPGPPLSVEKQGVRPGDAEFHPDTEADADADADASGEGDIDARAASDTECVSVEADAESDGEGDSDAVSDSGAGGGVQIGVVAGVSKRAVGSDAARMAEGGADAPGEYSVGGGMIRDGCGRERMTGGEGDPACVVREGSEQEAAADAGMETGLEAAEKTREEAVREFLQVGSRMNAVA